MPEKILSEEMREHLEQEHGHVYHGHTFAGFRVEQVPAVGRCRDCKWWIRHSRAPLAVHMLSGDCKNPDVPCPVTNELFGCIHFEAKP